MRVKQQITSLHTMTNATALSTAASIESLEPVRDRYGVIISAYGDIENIKQTVTLWVDARRENEQEIIKLTVPLTGPVKPLIEKYLQFELPGYEIYDWATWEEPPLEPLSELTALVNWLEEAA